MSILHYAQNSSSDLEKKVLGIHDYLTQRIRNNDYKPYSILSLPKRKAQKLKISDVVRTAKTMCYISSASLAVIISDLIGLDASETNVFGSVGCLQKIPCSAIFTAGLMLQRFHSFFLASALTFSMNRNAFSLGPK